jgi:hypothetical protein
MVGAFLCAVVFRLLIEDEPIIGQGRYGFLMPLLGLIFIAYAIGGDKLFKKSNKQPLSERQIK